MDQLVHAGDKGDFLLFSAGQQTLVEGLHGRIAAGGGDDGKVEGLAQLLNAGTADLRPAPNGAARLPFSRSDADVGHDLGGLVELGKIAEMSQPACGGGGADARDGCKQFLVLLEPFMPIHVNRDLSVDLPDLLVEMSILFLHGLDDEIQGISVLFEGLEAVLRGGSRLHELLPPGNELAELGHLGPFGFPRAEGVVPEEIQSVPGDDKSVLTVRLRPGKATLGKGLHRSWIENSGNEAIVGMEDEPCKVAVIDTCRLHADEESSLWIEREEELLELAEACRTVAEGLLTQLPPLFVQNPADEFGLRDVDADEDICHSNPLLRYNGIGAETPPRRQPRDLRALGSGIPSVVCEGEAACLDNELLAQELLRPLCPP